MKYISAISHKIPTVNKQVRIELLGQNLIITGGNGSGKTTLVKEIYQKIHKIIIKDSESILYNESRKEKDTKNYIKSLESQPHNELPLSGAYSELKRIQSVMLELGSGPEIEINNRLQFRKLVHSGKGLVEFFGANRQAKIDAAHGANAATYSIEELNGEASEKIGEKFEKHLTNLRTRRSFAITENPDPNLASKIEQWFFKLEADLKFLFEDDSTQLTFEPTTFKFFINQAGRSPYTFQTLSSGYSAIFHILLRLMMRAEYLNIVSSELSGVAIIDEIDAHLHVSLQRKILPFLTAMFPNVQFIVTTHSPFILASVTDAIIFDLTTQESSRDISSFSYDAILQSVFNVPTVSDVLRNKVIQLCNFMEAEDPDLNKMSGILESISEGSMILDEESAYYVAKAKLFLLKKPYESKNFRTKDD